MGNAFMHVIVIERSHRQLKREGQSRRVTVAGHPGDDLAPGTLNSILKQAGLHRREGKAKQS